MRSEQEGLFDSDEPPTQAPISRSVRYASSLWKWVLALLVAVLLAYPLIRRIGSDRGPAAAADDANSAEALVNRSLQAYQAGQYREAIRAAEAALKLRPDYAPAYNDLAVSYLGLHMYDEAIRNAQEALRVAPDFQLARNNLAWIQREKAQAAVPPAAQPGPGTSEFYIDQSLQAFQAGKFQESISAAQQALKLDPRSARAYNNMAAAYGSLKMWDKEIESAQRALEIEPDFQLAKNNLAWAQTNKAEASGTKPK